MGFGGSWGASGGSKVFMVVPYWILGVPRWVLRGPGQLWGLFGGFYHWDLRFPIGI